MNTAAAAAVVDHGDRDAAETEHRFALVPGSSDVASLPDRNWQTLLPPQPLLDSILKASPLHDTPLSKDLYIQLCKSTSYDNGLKRFWLDPSSGGDCYMISARGLSIAWGDTPSYWKWQPWPGAMSQEVAYLQTVCWFDISGVFQQVLRPGKYVVSFRMLLLARETGWQASPISLYLENTSYDHPPHLSHVFFDGTATFKRRFCPLPDSLQVAGMCGSNVHRQEEEEGAVESRHETSPFHTEWMEYDVGEFLVEDDNGGRPVEVQFSMKEVQVLWWKEGFVLDGVIIRPSFVAEKFTIA